MGTVPPEEASHEYDPIYHCMSCLCSGTVGRCASHGVSSTSGTVPCFILLDGESQVVPLTLLQCCCILFASEKLLCSRKIPL